MNGGNIRNLGVFFIFVFSASVLWAMGRPDDSEAHSVDGLENWDYQVDTSDLTPGEYNILVRGTDRAGNTGIGGPYNIFIDPSVQIPSVSISTPAVFSRVGNLVYVLGTAQDDEQVTQVEIAVDEGNFQPVDGTSFWSTTLDSSAWDDGLHTLTARARDADHNESPLASVSFYKDTIKPVIDIISHVKGSYISGKIELKGTVTDLNGIDRGAFSCDGGETFQPLKLSREKDAGLWSFSCKIDTRNFDDGALVFQVEAVDGLGSRSRQSFLFYIDNRPPELELISPEAEESVNGIFTLVGSTCDTVGIAELVYEADNGAAGNIELSPGNPVWVLPLDYNGSNKKEARVRMVLTDIVGNNVQKDFRIPLDAGADLPLPGLSDSAGTVIYNGVPVLTGMIIDDDGPSGKIEYSLNRENWNGIDVSGPWSIPLETAVPGVNSVDIRALDKYGTAGPVQNVEITVASPAPVIILDSVQTGEQASALYPGIIIDAKTQGLISGRVAGAGITALFWNINGEGRTPLSLKYDADSGAGTFVVKLPKNMPSGKMNLSVSGTDKDGNEISTATTYYNYLKPEEEDPAVSGYSIPDPLGIHLIYPDHKTSSCFVLGPGVYIGGWVTEGEIKTAELSGGNDFLSVETSGRGFRINAVKEGLADDVTLTVVLQDGTNLTSGPMNIASDNSAPEVTVDNLYPGMLEAEGVTLLVRAHDNTGPCRVYYSVDGGLAYNEIPLSENTESGAGLFSADVSFSGVDEGVVDLAVMATDLFGNINTVYFPLLKDTSAPKLDFITASFESGAEQITCSGHVRDNDTVSELTISFKPAAVDNAVADETVAETLLSPLVFNAERTGNVFYLDANLTSLGFGPDEVVVSAVDRAGNRTDKAFSLNVDLNKGRPVVDIQVPQEMDATETDIDLSGLILDREGVASVMYSLNEGPYTDIGTGNLFTSRISLEDMLDDLNTVKVRAVDVNGLESEIVSRSFLASFRPPEVSMEYPGLESVVRGTVVLKGTSTDVNGIREISISHDNGNTFQKAEGYEEWTYKLDTSLLNDGAASLLIRAVDGAGVSTLVTTIVNVDNDFPVIDLSHPADGEKVRGRLELSGRAVDNSGIDSFKIVLSRLDTDPDEAPSELIREISSRGTILEQVELDGMGPGTYSFRAEAVDAAENVGTASRIIEILPDKIRPPVLLCPLPGESLGPRFSVQGYLPDRFQKVLIIVNDEVFKIAEVNEAGYFRCDVSPEDGVPAGDSTLSLRIETGDGVVENESVEINYSQNGPWVTIDNLSRGQYITDRFVIKGSAGYEMPEADPEQLERLQPEGLMFSLDGGRTFDRIRIKNGSWEYTVYSEEVPDGALDLLLYTSVEDENACVRCKAVMDTRKPELSLLNPEENARLFGSLFLSGEAYDAGGLTDVSLSLREGNKDNYETPSFIQGMYFDASALGATYFTAGLGLTFMDDNVKLQVQYGYAPTTVVDPETNLVRSARFGGNVFGAKLLANLAQVPFSWLLGPEFSAFSATAALGANFSYFSSNSVDSDESWGVILAGVVGQLELPRISFENRSFLKYVSVFWEGQLWLISSDISPEVRFLPSIGIRTGLF